MDGISSSMEEDMSSSAPNGGGGNPEEPPLPPPPPPEEPSAAAAEPRRWTCEACGCNTNVISETNPDGDRSCSVCGTSQSSGTCVCFISIIAVEGIRMQFRCQRVISHAATTGG
jgi:hypothetical protein